MHRIPTHERRRRLVDAGLAVIARDGIHEASVRAIVREADMPLASFHYVFASRDEMIGEAYAFVSAAAVSATLEALPEGISPVEAIEATLQSWFAGLVAAPGNELGVMEIMSYCVRTEHLDHLPARVQQLYLEAIGEFVRGVEQKSGAVLQLSVEEAAELILTVTDGLTYSYLRARDVEASHRVIRRVARMLSTLFEPS